MTFGAYMQPLPRYLGNLSATNLTNPTSSHHGIYTDNDPFVLTLSQVIFHTTCHILAVTQYLAVKNSRRAVLHALDSLLERLVQVLDIVHPGGMQVSSRCSLGNACIIRNRIKRNINLLIRCLGPETIRVDKEE